MPAPHLPRDEVVERLAAVFRQYGYDGASLKRLSEATGLGRSSLYHYFPNGKEDMAAAVLDAAGHWVEREVVAVLEGEGPPRRRLEAAARKLAEFYDDGRRSCLLELFAMGDARMHFGPDVAATISRLRAALAGVAEAGGVPRGEAERRAEDALIAIQGALVVSRAIDRTDPFARVIRELPDRLLA